MAHPAIATLMIQTGLTMIDMGLKRLLPELAVMLDEPKIANAHKYIKPERLAKEVLDITLRRSLQS